MGNIFFFVVPKVSKDLFLEEEDTARPEVVLTMDVSEDVFEFSKTKWTAKILSS